MCPLLESELLITIAFALSLASTITMIAFAGAARFCLARANDATVMLNSERQEQYLLVSCSLISIQLGFSRAQDVLIYCERGNVHAKAFLIGCMSLRPLLWEAVECGVLQLALETMWHSPCGSRRHNTCPGLHAFSSLQLMCKLVARCFCAQPTLLGSTVHLQLLRVRSWKKQNDRMRKHVNRASSTHRSKAEIQHLTGRCLEPSSALKSAHCGRNSCKSIKARQ